MKIFSAEEEYKKNQKLKKKDVETLITWLKEQPHLPKITELELILFLHSCYYDMDQAKQTIDTYYTCKTNSPEIFAKWNTMDKKIQKDMEVMLFQPIDATTLEGYKIIFLKFQDANPSNFNVADQIRIFLMSVKLWLMQEGTAEGHIILMDMSEINTGHILRLSPFVLKKFFYFLQEAIPFRLKGFHFFDCSSIIDKLMYILRPFIKEDMVYIYTREHKQELYKNVPKKCLPSDYGGEQPSSDKLHAMMKEKLSKNSDYLSEIEKTLRVDESLRPGRDNNCTIS